MPDTERTDAELVAAFRAGQRTAFADVYDRYAAAVFSHFIGSGLTRAEAADATYDALLEAASRLEEKIPDDLATWILFVARGNGDPVQPEDILPPPAALRPRVLTRIEQVETSPPITLPALDSDTARMGLFILLTIVVGFVGLAVSARFQSAAPPATTPATTPADAVTTSTTTIHVTSTTNDPPTTSTEALAPAEIEVSSDAVDFGDEGTSAQFDVVNTGGEAADWSLSSSSSAIAVSAGEGELAGGETVTIELSLDRGEIEEGEMSETMMVTWSNGEFEVAVTAVHEDDPVIHNPQASPSQVHVGGDCTDTQTTISARVRDTSALASVVVRWSPDGTETRETEMTAAGDDVFEAVIGPFTAERTVEARIVAFDVRGNAGGATTTVNAVDCP